MFRIQARHYAAIVTNADIDEFVEFIKVMTTTDIQCWLLPLFRVLGLGLRLGFAVMVQARC